MAALAALPQAPMTSAINTSSITCVRDVYINAVCFDDHPLLHFLVLRGYANWIGIARWIKLGADPNRVDEVLRLQTASDEERLHIPPLPCGVLLDTVIYVIANDGARRFVYGGIVRGLITSGYTLPGDQGHIRLKGYIQWQLDALPERRQLNRGGYTAHFEFIEQELREILTFLDQRTAPVAPTPAAATRV